MAGEIRFMIIKDYYTENGDNCTDSWCIIYGTAQEAEEVKARLEAGQDKSFFDPTDLEASAFLYVDQIAL